MPHDGTLTLAFELAALRSLVDPGEVVDDARRWSENVLVVTDKPPYVQTKFEREFGIHGDFEPEPAPGGVTLEHAERHLDTERFVHVSVGNCDTPDGWERLSLEEAAADAGWDLAEATPDPGRGRVETSTQDWP